MPCDIWIPAARPDTLTGDNVGRLSARLVLQGANIPATVDAERWMHEQGIVSVPDFIANAGGVICAAIEYHGGTQTQAQAAIEERVRANTVETLERARARGVPPRRRRWRWLESASPRPCSIVGRETRGRCRARPAVSAAACCPTSWARLRILCPMAALM